MVKVTLSIVIAVDYPDLWPLAVDELLRVITDLAESVQDFTGAAESDETPTTKS